MSTGKRLAKRSILGTKVMVPGKDGRYYSGHIMAVKSPYDESASAPPRYSVRFEETRRTFEFAEKDVVGPGFSSVSSVQLLAGQVVYVTHNQREMQGRVVRHDFFAQDVLITVNQGGNEVGKKELISEYTLCMSRCICLIRQTHVLIRACTSRARSTYILSGRNYRPRSASIRFEQAASGSQLGNVLQQLFLSLFLLDPSRS